MAEDRIDRLQKHDPLRVVNGVKHTHPIDEQAESGQLQPDISSERIASFNWVVLESIENLSNRPVPISQYTGCLGMPVQSQEACCQ